MARTLLSVAAAALLAAILGADASGAGAPAPVKVALEAREIPLEACKTVSVGTLVRMEPAKDVPAGYDSLFLCTVGAGRGFTLRLLHKGLDPAAARFFWDSRPGRAPAEIPRMEKRIHANYVAFGPLALKGLPPLTFHMYLLAGSPEAQAARARSIYVVPLQCVAGTAVVGGKTLLVGLLDRTLNGRFDDACALNATEGDWILFDRNGDGALDLNVSGNESLALTPCVELEGTTWKVTVRGRALVLQPVKLPVIRIRLAGLGTPCSVQAWSCATGIVNGELDAEGWFELPRDRAQLHSYSWTKDSWRLVGALRTLGVLDPPAAGIKEFEVGPALQMTLTRAPEGDSHKFTFKCVGRAQENVTLYKDGKRVQPVFVVSDASGAEVLREEKSFG